MPMNVQEADETPSLEMHVNFRDPSIIRWLESVHPRSKSRVIEEVLSRGLGVYGDELDHLRCLLVEITGRLSQVETACEMTSIATIGQQFQLDHLLAGASA